MKRRIHNVFFVLFICILFTTPVCADNALAVIDDTAEYFKGEGTAEKPFIYSIDGESRVSWKHLVTIKQTGDIEIYECHENNDTGRKLLYSFMFNPVNLKETPDGPYYLGLRKYDKEKTEGLPEHDRVLYFSLANKREFPGEVQISLDVSDTFHDGETLILMYYGGYDGAVIHGAAPVVMEDEILEVEDSSIVAKDIAVRDGYVKFFVKNGGNFVLTPEVLDFSSLERGNIVHYDSTKVLGTLDGLFPNREIAEIIAEKIGCKITDTVTQADIDTITSLYLADLNLDRIDEISRTCFFRLESLDLSGNSLEEITGLSMPHLKNLNVSNNKIKSLAFISGLDELMSVDASANQIVSLPDLNEFPELQSLDLHGNNLKILPSLEKTKLRYLDISGNSGIEIKGDLEKIDSVVCDSIMDKDGSGTNNKINYKFIAGAGLVFIVIAVIAGGLLYTKKRGVKEKYDEK